MWPGKTGMFRNKLDLLRIIRGIHFKKGGMSLEAAGVSLHQLLLSPELIWKEKEAQQ
jgi:hypothetical protein